MSHRPGAPRRVAVGQWVDEHILNAQSLNARWMLHHFRRPGVIWTAFYHRRPDPRLVGRDDIRLVRLHRHRLNSLPRIAFEYLRCDAIFYPSHHWTNAFLLPGLKLLRQKTPVVGTIEALGRDEGFFRRFPDLREHEKAFFLLPGRIWRKGSRITSRIDHFIAISGFLEEMGRRIHGPRVSCLPLGIDGTIFHPRGRKAEGGTPTVVSAGTLSPRKRPEVFLEAARRHPGARFVWYGEGPLREPLRAEAARQGISNLEFPGAVANEMLGDVYRAADLFALPSHCEGVPKVSQEAAACGLPLVLFGHYRPPTVAVGRNGFLAWSDEEFFAKVGALLVDGKTRREFGESSARMAEEWGWDKVAPRWEDRILELIGQYGGR
jgi:glycosyltransferase involved in cell wall biosynthesis